MNLNKSKGISLIVLIVTIIVVIILAAVVILTLSKNNPIESAKEARFKEDVRTFQDELALSVSKQYAEAGGHRDYKINTTDFEDIKDNIPSFSEKYKDKFVIENDELRYTGNLDEKEKEYAKSLNVKEKNLLPDEYQQVEYIESTGTQYIDTNVKPTINTKVKCVLSSKKMGTNQNIAYYGARTSYNESTNFGFLNYSTSSKLRFDRGDFVFSGYSNLVQAGTFYEIFQDKNENYVDGLKVSESNGSFDDVNYNIYIFGINEKGNYIKNTAWAEDEISFKFFKIYNNDEVVRDFIPCYTTTTVTNVDGVQVPANTKGMYDLVEGKFYTNQGTGEDFIPGPEVN